MQQEETLKRIAHFNCALYLLQQLLAVHVAILYVSLSPIVSCTVLHARERQSYTSPTCVAPSAAAPYTLLCASLSPAVSCTLQLSHDRQTVPHLKGALRCQQQHGIPNHVCLFAKGWPAPHCMHTGERLTNFNRALHFLQELLAVHHD